MAELKFHHKPSMIGFEEANKYAVCIPLIRSGNDYEILFEVRSKKIEKQPGDVCFPGGFIEEGELPFMAALRESEEELLIKKEQLHLLGLCDLLYNGRLCIYPYAGILSDYKGSYSKDEVDHTFTVPLSFFLNTSPKTYVTNAKVFPPENFPFEKIYGGRNYQWRSRKETVYFYEYKDHVIWGITAKIIHSFAKICLEEGLLD